MPNEVTNNLETNDQTEVQPEVTPEPTAEEFAAMKRELEQLKAQTGRTAELEAELATLRVAAAAKASSGTVALNLGSAEVVRTRAIAAAGGAARWHAIAPNKRAELLGVTNPEQFTNVELEQVFGPKSSAPAASRLAKENPVRYRAMRAVARERSIL